MKSIGLITIMAVVASVVSTAFAWAEESPAVSNCTWCHGAGAQGYTVAQVMVEVLKNCKDDVSRDNIIKQSTNLKGLALPLLLPGIKVQNNPSDVTPIRQIQMARFDGKTWALFGDILGDE